jgi:hypothetical protein
MFNFYSSFAGRKTATLASGSGKIQVPTGSETVAGGGGGGGDAAAGLGLLAIIAIACCVVATALHDMGEMSDMQYAKVNLWASKKLDKSWVGERIHRGYHMIAPKTWLPMLKTPLKAYAKWSFNNTTRLLMKRKVDLLSIPNSLLWISIFFITGLVISKEQAVRSWQSVYKK